MARPPETLSRPAAVWSSAPGVREKTLRMPGADLQGLGLGGEVAHERGGVVAVGLGDPGDVEAGLLEGGDGVGRVARVAVVLDRSGEEHGPIVTVELSRSQGRGQSSDPPAIASSGLSGASMPLSGIIRSARPSVAQRLAAYWTVMWSVSR